MNSDKGVYLKGPGRLTTQQVVSALIAADMVDRSQADKAIAMSQGAEFRNLHPLTQISRLNLPLKNREGKYLTAAVLTQWVAEQVGLPYYTIDPLNINAHGITSVMSYEFARRQGVMPVEISDQEILVATSEPFVTGWESTIEQVTRKEISRVLAIAEDIERYSQEYFHLARSVSGASQKGYNQGQLGNFEQLLELGNLKTPDANDEGIVNVVDWLLQYAFEQRASDIHIEPRREKVLVRFRIDGILHQVYDIPFQVGLAVISRIKILGRMNVAEKRRPQDGRLKTKSPDGNEIELRLSTLPTAFGEKLVLRIFDPDVLLKPFEELGLGHDELKLWESLTAERHGIILVTGPTGSGKTTTLYSTLKQLAEPTVNVCTIEDPIEMVEDSFNQMQVQTNIDLNFADGVKALLRQDPDIIMIGETRDFETASMAIQSALTGHLVLTSLHTNDAPSAITRLLDLGIPAYLIRSSLLGVMAQRLVRTLCPHCKNEVPVDEQAWKELLHPWSARKPGTVFEPVGCIQCRFTGYMGRAGIYELFRLTPELAELIQEQVDVRQFRQSAMKQGMQSLRLSGARKVASGLTSISEVVRVCP